MKKKIRKKALAKKSLQKTQRTVVEDSCGGSCDVVNGSICDDCAEWGGILSGNTKLYLVQEQETIDSENKVR